MTIIASVLAKIERIVRKMKNSALRADSQYVTVEKWYKEDANHDKKVRFDELNEHSTVFDLGGYKGEWTSDIYSRYNCRVHVFEPVTDYAKLIKDRFNKNPKISVHAFGLGPVNSTAIIFIDEFASSMNKASSAKKSETIEIISFDEFIRLNNITRIDLAKINIEGAEYDLLDQLIISGNVRIINKLLIQFHVFVPKAKERRQKISEKLKLTHSLLFEYPFVWECWEKNNLDNSSPI